MMKSEYKMDKKNPERKITGQVWSLRDPKIPNHEQNPGEVRGSESDK